MSSAAIALVESIYTAFAAGNVPAVLAAFDASIVWNEAEGFPYSDGNPYQGPAAVLAGVFARLPQDWRDFQVEVKELAGGPDMVVMLGRYRGWNRASGRELNVQCSHTWWVRGNKVVRFQQMVDTAAVARALG